MLRSVNRLLARWLGSADALLNSRRFSLGMLRLQNPPLAHQYLWSENQPIPATGPRWLHWGCGDNFLEDFINIDFRPSDTRVLDWDFLNPWPVEACQSSVLGAYSEDVLEHFFIGEQAYILCSLNALLEPGAVARILMPSYARLVEKVRERDARPGGFLHDTFGATTEVDAINMGMRFSGHRWLHDNGSFSHLAVCSGFEAVPTTCAESSVARFRGLNLRSETDSASFATDLHKRWHLQRCTVPPDDIQQATLIETLEGGIQLYRADGDEPCVNFHLPHAFLSEDIACLNIRSANVSSFRDHYYKSIDLIGRQTIGSWRLDETVKSKASMNLLTRDQIRLATCATPEIVALRFKPARKDEFFTLGNVEMFYRAAD